MLTASSWDFTRASHARRAVAGKIDPAFMRDMRSCDFLILHRDNAEHVGNCGLHRFNWQTRVFEIGWWCRRRYQRQGFITEAAAALTEFAFQHLGARRVWCLGDEENMRSWRVAERLGFVFEGTLKSERGDPNGTRRDMRVYAVTR